MKKVNFRDTDHLIVQSMTNTKTKDVQATLNQINQLQESGCELVRVAIFDDEDMQAIPTIVKQSPLPIIADIHFNYEYAIKAIEAGVFKIRLNPGNINKENEINEIIKVAQVHGTWIRIGVNSGSLDTNILETNNYDVKATMIEMLKRYLEIFEKAKFNQIVISLKCSDPLLNEAVNLLAASIFDYPIHLGVTEAGSLIDATIKSTIGLSNLIRKKIGSTIRISISADPVKEVEICYKLLNYLGIIHNRVNIISCPTCGRLNYDLFTTVKAIEEYCKNLYFPLTISILGCVVNGIGEGKHADIGLAGSGNKALLFEKGKIIKTIDASKAIDELKKLIDKYYQEYLNQKY